ncbi:MAG: tRNA (guanosine(37)-N1)-methyltransferase TrmD [Pseudomonadota bacterium]
MWFGVVTLFPELVLPITEHGVVGRGFRNGLLALDCLPLRDFAIDRHGTVDDKPYGGGAGMVLRVDVVAAAVAAAQNAFLAHRGEQDPAPAFERARVVALSPHGRRLDQQAVNRLALEPGLVLLCGRYEGFDQRVHDALADETLSIGDYVLSGGELPAQVLIDAIARQLPDVLGNPASAEAESHLAGLLDYPHYTRPEFSEHGAVPPVLLGGNHQAVDRWRRQQSLVRTYRDRPDLLAMAELDAGDRALLAEGLAEAGAAALRGAEPESSRTVAQTESRSDLQSDS